MFKFLDMSLTLDANVYCADIYAAVFADDATATAPYLEVDISPYLEV